MNDDIRHYQDGEQAPLSVVVLNFETDFVTRKVNGVDKQVPRDKVVLGKIGDAQYRQEMWVDRLSGERCDSPRLWHELIKPAYEGWKRGEEVAMDGTPLAVLGFIPPKLIQAWRLQNVHTAEHLAKVEDGDLPRLGLDARKYRDGARKYLDAANGETAKIVAKQREQDETIAAQNARIAELEAALAAKKEPKQRAAA
jgi:hypothetical protein